MTRTPAKDRMMSYLPEYYQAFRVMKAIFSAQGQEIDKLFDALDQSLDQFFVTKSTWGLFLWEELLGLPINESLPTEERRRRVLAKRRGVSQPLLVILRAIAPALDLRFGGDILNFVLPVGHNAEEYDFGILVPTLEIRKPAHKAYAFQLLPPDPKSGYVIYGNHDAGRGKVSFQPEVGSFYSGRWPTWSNIGKSLASVAEVKTSVSIGHGIYEQAGNLYSGHIRTASSTGIVLGERTGIQSLRSTGISNFAYAGPHMAGELPVSSTSGTKSSSVIQATAARTTGRGIWKTCGAMFCGEEVA